ncbi:alpha/beta fold hydrolase [Rathayibacter sp. CAU 1779]
MPDYIEQGSQLQRETVPGDQSTSASGPGIAPQTTVGRPPMPEVAGVRHRTVEVLGAAVHVAEAGADDAPPVILLHGFPQHWYAWRHLIPALAAERRVIAIDLPGFGWSEPSRIGYSTDARTRALVALLDELGLATVDVVGHDWGAWLGFRMAMDAPERVGRFVSIGELHPWPLQRRLVPSTWRMWVTALFEAPGIGVAVQKRRRTIAWFLRRDARDPSVWSDELVDAYADATAVPETSVAGQKMHAAFIAHDIPRLILRRDRSRSFATPTLLVAADNDRYIPAWLMKPPRSREGVLSVRTVRGGHFVLDENPDAVGRVVLEHLALAAG